MDERRSCCLLAVDGSHGSIKLPHNEVVTLGRGPITNIVDKRLSRNQVEVTADVNLMKVKLKNIGPNAAGYNGFLVKQNSQVTMQHNDKIHLLFNQYVYRVEFTPAPKLKQLTQKRTLSSDTEVNLSKKLCEKSDQEQPRRNSQEFDEDKPPRKSSDKDNEEINSGESVNKDCEPAKENTWESVDNGKLLIYTSKGIQGKSKIASYDVDGTIITTKSGRVFPVDCNDWKIAFPEVTKKLKLLHDKDYKIVFFSNQAGIGRGKVKVADFRNKIKEIVKKIDLPIQVFVATGDGMYRKPVPGMWRVLVEEKNDDVEVNMAESFYCGDAAGREVNWAPKKKKDFSCSDRLFALNLGLKFYTPEEHFLRMAPGRYKLPDFNPSALNLKAPICDPPDAKITSDTQEVVILVGFPGSGKSFFAATYLVPAGYIHINRDQLGSWQKCASAMESALVNGKSVAIDNTNPDKESRKRFIEVAARRKVPCRCFLLTTSIQQAKHNNKFREFTDNTHQKINDIIINMYKNKFEEPSCEEGFSAILKINCVPKINDPELRKLYKMYLIDK